MNVRERLYDALMSRAQMNAGNPMTGGRAGRCDDGFHRSRTDGNCYEVKGPGGKRGTVPRPVSFAYKTRKKAVRKKAVVKKAVVKKAVVKKVAARKPAARRPAARRPAGVPRVGKRCAKGTRFSKATKLCRPRVARRRTPAQQAWLDEVADVRARNPEYTYLEALRHAKRERQLAGRGSGGVLNDNYFQYAPSSQAPAVGSALMDNYYDYY